jgi:2-oxoglutarate dehydrogenase E2 component (dihydrolipoamide succinyltransferase)
MPDILLILIVILILVVVWRGPKNLPKLGEALGRGVREAKSEATKAQAEIQARASGEAMEPTTTAAPATAAPAPAEAAPAPAAPAAPAAPSAGPAPAAPAPAAVPPDPPTTAEAPGERPA